MLVDTPGNTESSTISIDVGGTTPLTQAPYRIPDKLKEGAHTDINKLSEAGIITVPEPHQ